MQNEHQSGTPKQRTHNVAVRYDQAAITHTSQFLLSPGDDELLIDLSSGLIRESTSDETLPIHTRLSMSWATAARLAELMNQVVKDHAAVKSKPNPRRSTPNAVTVANGKAVTIPKPTYPQASIPTIDANQGTA